MKGIRKPVILGALFWLALTPFAQAQAAEAFTTIYQVLEPSASTARTQGGNETLVLLSSGRVLRVDDAESLKLIKEHGTAMRAGGAFDIKYEDLGDRDVIYSVEPIPMDRARGIAPDDYGITRDDTPPGPVTDHPTTDHPTPNDNDHPSTDDDDWDNDPGVSPEVQDLFDFMKGKHLRKEAQCFHRAYLWAYDTWTQRDTATKKVFMFFTQKYVRQYNYKWWFHVAPFIDSGDDEMVLDPTFNARPRQMRNWTNVFIQDDHYCPTTAKYMGYTAQFQDKYCYLRKVPMYYYHPSRVEAADRGGYVITKWDQGGLNASKVARP